MKRLPHAVFALSALCFAAFMATPDLRADRIEQGNLVIDGIPEIPERVTDRLNQYQNTRSSGLSGWLPGNGGILISTRFAETSQIHHVKMPGGARTQLTFFKEPVTGASISPNPKVNGFIFGRDVGGSEFYQLYFQDLKTGQSRMLTDGTGRNGGVSWAHDGERYVYYTTSRNDRDWDIHLADIHRPGWSEPLLEVGGAWFPGEWSPDDTRVLVTRYVSANEVYPCILNVETKELTQLNPGDEKIAYSGAAWAPDGKGIYFSSDEGSEFKHLRHYDLASKKITTLTQDIPWDLQSLTISDDGRHLAFIMNEDGLSKLYVRTLPGMKGVSLPELPAGLVYSMEFSPDSRSLGLVLNTPQTPGDVFSIDLGSKRLTRWTWSEVGGLDTAELATPDLVHYETFDEVAGKKREIPAFVYKPKGKGPHPVIINIHGGPEGQARPVFSATRQYWVNELGATVIRPNVRGSNGYGKSYLKLDNGFNREDSVKDIGALLDWIEAQPDLDADRVAVYGGSYGGYMVLASMTNFNDRLRCGVDVVGISNFVTFLENTKEYRRDLRRVEYGDERDPEMRAHLERISPDNNATKITKPLFVVQGLNDPRVPAGESEQMVEVIRGNGGDVWYLLARDEGHGFKKKANSDYYQAAASYFLEQTLLPDSVAQGD